MRMRASALPLAWLWLELPRDPADAQSWPAPLTRSGSLAASSIVAAAVDDVCQRTRAVTIGAAIIAARPAHAATYRRRAEPRRAVRSRLAVMSTIALPCHRK